MPNPPFNGLYAALKESLNALNFVEILAKRQFQRANSSGYSSVVLSVAGREPTEIEVFLGIRINLVEELVYQFTNGLRDYGPFSTTLLVSGRKVAPEFPYFYRLAKEADVHATKQQILSFLHQYGFPFLDKHQSAKSLDALYNQEVAQKSFYVINEFHRALRGIILAKLAKRPNWEELVEQYRVKLQKKALPEVQMQNYEQLVNFLKYHSFS